MKKTVETKPLATAKAPTAQALKPAVGPVKIVAPQPVKVATNEKKIAPLPAKIVTQEKKMAPPPAKLVTNEKKAVQPPVKPVAQK